MQTHVWPIPTIASQASARRAFRRGCRRPVPGAALEYRTYAAGACDPDGRARIDSQGVSGALGIDPILVCRSAHRCSDYQCSIRNCGEQAIIPGTAPEKALSHSGGCFYEWRRSGKQRQPFCFEVSNGSLFAFAGLWDRWQGPDGDAVESCTILTTTANSLVAPAHDRMPAILAPDHYDRWLDPAMRDAATALGLLRTFASDLMRRYPVSARVNAVANDDPECSAPFELPAETETLFT
jgi:SOS response associated peptidase (SRAP)